MIELRVTATNRITDAGYAYDAAGNMTNDALHTYAYDAENQVKAVDSTAASYTYLDGLRVKKVVATTSTVYIYSGDVVIAEYLNSAPATQPNKEYVYSDDSLLATIASDGTTTYQHSDHLSTRMETSAPGAAIRSFGHYPFGETWYETGTASKWKFTSYERDSESGVDYATFRNYSSRLGRFMQADLLAGSVFAPQSLNRYSYVRNDPVRLRDPLGLFVNPGQPWDGGPIDTNCDLCPQREGGGGGGSTDGPLPLIKKQPGGGGGGGGGVLGKVVAALSKKACRDLFGKNVDPFALLFEVLGGSDGFGPSYTGFFDFGDNSGNVAAKTVPVFNRGNVTQPNGTTVYTNLGIVGAGIAINSNPAAPWQAGYSGRYGLNDVQNRAVTFIHELGHAAEFLFGPGSTQIKSDVEDPTHTISQANSKLIADKCFK